MTQEINGTNAVFAQTSWCIECDWNSAWEGVQSCISNCCCDIGNLIGRVTQFWQVIPILAMTVWCVIHAIESLFSGMVMTSLGFVICASVLLFSASYVIQHYLIEELHRANAELREQVDRVGKAADLFTQQLDTHGIQLEKVDTQIGTQEGQLNRFDAQNERLEVVTVKITQVEQNLINATKLVQTAFDDGKVKTLVNLVSDLQTKKAVADEQIKAQNVQIEAQSAHLKAQLEQSAQVSKDLKESSRELQLRKQELAKATELLDKAAASSQDTMAKSEASMAKTAIDAHILVRQLATASQGFLSPQKGGSSGFGLSQFQNEGLVT